MNFEGPQFSPQSGQLSKQTENLGLNSVRMRKPLPQEPRLGELNLKFSLKWVKLLDDLPGGLEPNMT